MQSISLLNIVQHSVAAPIVMQFRLVTSFIASCNFLFSSMLMFALRLTNQAVNVEFPVIMLQLIAYSHSASFSNKCYLISLDGFFK